jgi:quercetin dioxygenase-like cupin family protein
VSVEIRPFPRGEWSAIPAEGANGVESRALRFAEHATIHEHPSPNEIIALCLEGEGFTSVEQAHWSPGFRTASGPRARRC